jgi:hypothetical protein
MYDAGERVERNAKTANATNSIAIRAVNTPAICLNDLQINPLIVF